MITPIIPKGHQSGGAARILLTPEELTVEANNLMKAAQENDDVIKALDTVMNGISGWEGEAQRAFVNSYRTKRKIFQKLTREMKELANDVRKFANNMKSEENQAKGKAEKLGN